MTPSSYDTLAVSEPTLTSDEVRALNAKHHTANYGRSPLVIVRGEGMYLWDADGNRYLDFVHSWGPLILGHAHPGVLAAVTEAAARGLTFGAPHLGEVELAERVAQCYPGVERVRFTSSGTEATMSAIRLARGVTGRDRLVKFAGCYHGHSDALLVAAGSGAITLGEPSSAGVPRAVAELTTVLPLDDDAALDALFAARGHEIAAVILEPIPANNGLLLQRREWLQKLRDLTRAHGALLIFDEVISGFRVAMGGAAQRYGITPDLVTFGKILGGGMPVGAFAGPAALFAKLAPLGPVYQAGTLSGNPVAMAAGLRTLEILAGEHVHARLEKLGERLERGVRAHLAAHPEWPATFVREGSLFWLLLGGREAPRRDDRIPADGARLYRTFHRACLERGVYLAPSAYEVGFLSAAHTDADLDRALAVFGDALAKAFAEVQP